MLREQTSAPATDEMPDIDMRRSFDRRRALLAGGLTRAARTKLWKRGARHEPVANLMLA